MIFGLLLVLSAGVLQGSFLLPSKWLRHWSWENYWLIFAVSAYLVCPWLLAVATIPDLLEVYRGVPLSTVVAVMLFGLGWGLGAVSFGLGVDALGMALGFAVILGVATMSGTLVPLIVAPPAAFSPAHAWVTGIALGVMLVGIAICSFAGRWKQQDASSAGRISYRLGLLICIASGLLSSCGNLGYVWGEPIYLPLAATDRASYFAPNALWPLLTPPLFLCNAGFAIYR
ncbi:MAG TPA: L-rhamnose/proton symporter RhaT, partial [Pirellulales bacterium]|nr:L-rhamnose/proton symporter RhaT [Pirellulales bacterium]